MLGGQNFYCYRNEDVEIQYELSTTDCHNILQTLDPDNWSLGNLAAGSRTRDENTELCKIHTAYIPASFYYGCHILCDIGNTDEIVHKLVFRDCAASNCHLRSEYLHCNENLSWKNVVIESVYLSLGDNLNLEKYDNVIFRSQILEIDILDDNLAQLLYVLQAPRVLIFRCKTEYHRSLLAFLQEHVDKIGAKQIVFRNQREIYYCVDNSWILDADVTLKEMELPYFYFSPKCKISCDIAKCKYIVTPVSRALLPECFECVVNHMNMTLWRNRNRID